MNQRFLVKKVIALLRFGQTQVVVSFRFDVCCDSNLSLRCLYLFFCFKV